MVDIVAEVLSYVARAGGGGSGGGGGGGGGGGSGGGGGGIIALAAIGYIPMSWFGRLFRKVQLVLLGSFVLWPIACIACIVLIYLSPLYGGIIGVGALIGTGAGLYGWFGKAVQFSKRPRQDMQLAAATDPGWDQTTVLAKTAKIFMDYQADWSTGNLASIKTYTSEYYYGHISLMIEALQLAKRSNPMSDVVIKNQSVFGMYNPEGPDSDTVTVGFESSAHDTLIDTQSGETLYTDRSTFIEYWTFLRRGNEWILDHINQETEDASSIRTTLQSFAAENRYYYSPDWGWLLLPRRGQLFGRGKFGVSDINNHIIGHYEDALVQLYTYQPNPSADSAAREYYLIAQMYTVSSYGSIVVRRKKMLSGLFGAPKGLSKIEMEWTQFNAQYEVYASSAEGASSFELLEPTYMEKLAALPFEVNIEVVDNVVYLYSKERSINSSHYPQMMEILHEAYRHMKH